MSVELDLIAEIKRMRKDPNRGDDVFRCRFNGALDNVIRLIEASAAPAEGRYLLGQAGASLTADFARVGEQFMDMCSELGCPDNTNMLDWARSKIAPPAAEACDTCHGKGQVCVGTSGRESDGNAPEFERCPSCGYGDAPAEGREETFEQWVERYRKGKPYWSQARIEICKDAWTASRAALSAAKPADGREAADTRVYYGGQREPHSIAFDDAEGREAVDERAAFIDAYVATLPADGSAAFPTRARQFAESVIAANGPGWQLWQARAALATAPSATPVEYETAVETLRHVINCLRSTGSYTDEEGEATDYLEPLLSITTAPTKPADRDLQEVIEAAKRVIGSGVVRDGKFAASVFAINQLSIAIDRANAEGEKSRIFR